MRIFLAGGGSEKDSFDVDKAFSDGIKTPKKIIYVPIAMETDDYSDCLEWIKSTFSAFQISNIKMITKLDKISAINSAVYIGGGNTYKLLKEIKETSFDKKLTKHVKNNGIVYGGSAGAIVMGKTVLTSSDRNNVGLTDFEGLDLIKGFSVWCHYEKRHKRNVLDFIDKNSASVIALTEKSGVLFDGTSLVSIGSVPALVFKDGEEIIIENKAFPIR